MEQIPNRVATPSMYEKESKIELTERKLEIGKILSQEKLVFSFPGIKENALNRLRNSEEEYPGFVTPIDELINRCEKEGIKVVLSTDPTLGRNIDVFILPAGSDDILNDSIRPEHLQIGVYMDGNLSELIHICAQT